MMIRRRHNLRLLLLSLLLRASVWCAGVEAGGCVCKGRLLFGGGPCWPLWAPLQLRESILLERAHAVAAVRDLMGPAGSY